MNYVTNKSEMPVTTHLAALVFDSIHIEGDERSRTNPGHGYPAHNEQVCHYIAFASPDECSQWIEQKNKAREDNYVIIHAGAVNVQIQTVVKIQK